MQTQDYDDNEKQIDPQIDPTKAEAEATPREGNGGGIVPAVKKATPDIAAPPGMKYVNPFAAYAEQESSPAFFAGDYVKIDQEKREYIRGKDKKPIGATQAWVAHIYETRHGWIKFAKSDGEDIERDIVLIRQQPQLPPCPACGDVVDEHDDKRCSWRSTVYLLLRSVTDPNDVVCFTGTGKGARVAVAELCRIYGRPGADRQGKSPVIALNTRSFENKNRSTTTWPDFKFVGWDFFVPGVSIPDVQPITVPITPATETAKALTSKRGDMDDEIPF
jgi:hypothetical protein